MAEREHLENGISAATPEPFVGDSGMAARMRTHDWSASPLGVPTGWPASLRAIVSLMLGSRFPMFIAWGDRLTLLYNDAYLPILGSKHPDALGAPLQDIWSEVWTDVAPLVGQALAGEAVWIENLPLRVNRSGTSEDASFTFSYSPARDDAGAITGLFCTCIETTGQMRADAGQRELTLSFESRDEARSSRLGEVEEQLRQSQKMEAIGQLTGGVAHDFNNLLTVIRGSVDLLRRPDLADDRRRRYVDAIGDTADRAAKLTGQLLAFARRQALKPELFDVGASIEDVAGMIRTLIGSRVRLKAQAPSEPVFILADRSQFDTALVNMAVNARDAMGGEGKLTIAAKPVSGIPAIRAHPPVAGDHVAVTITDTGGGIEPNQLTRIFEPFYTTKSVGQGTGLGLSQAIGFAKQSGGDIRVESTVGKGAALTLYLPRAYPKPAEATISSTAEPATGGAGVCVLVVEDNAQVRAFAAEALEELGYGSIMVSDAEQALAELHASRDRFHVVFSDVVMPGMSGVEMGEKIRELYPDMPVILTSGYSHVLAQNGKHGFELLHKPYSVDQLSRVLGKVVSWQS